MYADALEQKIKNPHSASRHHRPWLCGLAVAVEFAKAAFPSRNRRSGSKVTKLNAGESYVQDVPSQFWRR